MNMREEYFPGDTAAVIPVVKLMSSSARPTVQELVLSSIRITNALAISTGNFSKYLQNCKYKRHVDPGYNEYEAVKKVFYSKCNNRVEAKAEQGKAPV